MIKFSNNQIDTQEIIKDLDKKICHILYLTFREPFWLRKYEPGTKINKDNFLITFASSNYKVLLHWINNLDYYQGDFQIIGEDVDSTKQSFSSSLSLDDFISQFSKTLSSWTKNGFIESARQIQSSGRIQSGYTPIDPKLFDTMEKYNDIIVESIENGSLNRETPKENIENTIYEVQVAYPNDKIDKDKLRWYVSRKVYEKYYTEMEADNYLYTSGPIQSSRRIQSMRTPKNVYLNEDTQKLIQRLEKRVGHELKLKFEEGNTPYVEIEKLPKGGYSFITDKYLNNLAEHFLYDGYKEKQDSFIVYLDPAIMYTRPGIKSAYTREDYDRFDEVGNFIPYKPTEEELAKKDEIKTVLKQELSDAYEPDPMDDYVGYDSTNERIDMACERVAKQFGVDTDFVEEIAGEIQNEKNARQYEEAEWAEKNLKGDEYDKWCKGELDIRDRIHSSRRNNMIKSSQNSYEEGYNAYYNGIIKEYNPYHDGFGNESDWNAGWDFAYSENENIPVHEINGKNYTPRQIKSSYEDAFIVIPWDKTQVIGTSDEDLGLSYVVEAYGNEFVNVDDETLNDIRDEVLLRYFDDDAYVRDWNINNPDYQIEDAFEVTDPEEMDTEDLARYFDYEAYGRDIRLEYNMVWDSENQYWISAHDVDDEELNNDKYFYERLDYGI